MSTVDTDQLLDTITSLKEAASSALGNDSVDDLESFERYLNEVDAYVREMQQSAWTNEAKATIRRLEKGETLTNEDKSLIRAFLISDAEGYLQQENNFQDWKRELQRLVADMSKQANMVKRDSIPQLRGTLKDAIRLVPDIRNYMDEKRRVEKFEQALKTLDRPSREMLCRVLREQLFSAKR